MPRPARIVYLIENLALGGGIETVLWTFLRGVSRERFELIPWFLSEAGPSFERMRAAFPETRFLHLRTYHRPGPLRQLATELRAVRADAIHAHGYFSGAFGRLVAPWLGLPWVYSLYSHYEDVYRWQHYLMESWLAKSRGLVVACSNAVGEFALTRCHIPREKVVVNYEGVDVPLESTWMSREAARDRLGVPRDAFLVGTVTRFYPGKNTQLLIRAVAGLPESCHVLLAGSGTEQPVLEELARSLGISARVHFVGLLADVAPADLAMDLFAQTSLIREGFSIALIEAMAYARPIAATAIGGNVEAITTEHGWLVSPHDPAELRAVIRRAMEDPQRLAAMGRASRARYLAHFTGGHMVRGMEAVYDRVLSR